MKSKRLILLLLVAAGLLLLPFIAMQFTSEVQWSGSDFLVMGALLTATALLIELVLRTVRKRTNRLILCIAVLGALALIWMELAVGVFGTPFAGS